MPSTARPSPRLWNRARRTLCLAAFAGLAPLATPLTQAAEYPARTVELIVPWAVGGGSDAVARAFADAATRQTGQPFIVVNRPGASGSIGHQEGAAARPDGYKLTLVTPEISLAYLQGIGKTQWNDFQYIARINKDPIALVVKADAPWKSLEQFMDYARSNPGKASISNSGVGATYHLAAIAVEKKTGLSFNNVPYIGAGPAVIGLLGGQVDATFATSGEVGVHVKGGKLRMLAVLSEQRLKDFDQVPTFREKQIDVQLSTWRALAAPKATPPQVLATLRKIVGTVSQDSNYRDLFARQFLGPANEDGESFRVAIEKENVTLPPKNVSLAEWFNASKENGNDEDSTGALHAGIQAGGGAAGPWRAEHRSGGQDAGRGGADAVQLGQGGSPEQAHRR
ncbi:tripartite tricarboxylate transporter substrate binding protein [Verminephrobacter eiseniae]|uniref:tripartite tricarboxylate transporter substrate binding protein n=1 Tax=Verminephrobacter eiseniae TaxID=364317 RepID=UPI002243B4E7|nr:tripartite tricarboxylate transporter substrate binding protein [Verminephrobacter eiseniae]